MSLGSRKDQAITTSVPPFLRGLKSWARLPLASCLNAECVLEHA
jgi:hypothetical protein